MAVVSSYHFFIFSFFINTKGERPHSNLSRMVLSVWVFVALVLTQIYTANLASILTVQGLEPTVTNIESLQSSNAKVGHTQASFVKSYLVDVLHFMLGKFWGTKKINLGFRL